MGRWAQQKCSTQSITQARMRIGKSRLTLIDEGSFPGLRIGQIHAEFHPIAAIPFRLIHGGIGNRDQKFWITIGSAKSDSDTYGERHIVIAKFQAFAIDGLAYAF